MKETISQALELPGHTVAFITKTFDEWKQQAEEAMQEAEKYGATTPNQMRNSERDKLREALIALKQNVKF